MPARALAVLLFCAAVLASVTAGAVHLLSGVDTAAAEPRVGTAAAPVVAPAAPSTIASAPVTTAEPSAPVAGTRRVNLTPVDASGAPAAGYTVTAGDTEVSCGDPSPAAVSPGIWSCSPSAASADVCWPAPGGASVTCLMDAWDRELVRYPATGASGQVAAPPSADPLGLELADGTRCRLRNGGAWGGRDDDPDAYGAYGCSETEDEIVWARQDRDAVDDSSATWTVRVGSPSGPLRTVPVATAYFAA